jgi:tetratricopeptide (TPR) repeat protein
MINFASRLVATLVSVTIIPLLPNHFVAAAPISPPTEQASQQNLAEQYNKRGWELMRRMDFKGAILYFDQAINLNPNYADSYQNRARSRQALEDYRGAEADFDQLIRLKPNDAEAYFLRRDFLGDLAIRFHTSDDQGQTLYLTSKDQNLYRRALADYEQAIRLSPDNARYWRFRGVLSYNLGDYARAIADYTQQIKLEPDKAEPYSNRALARGGAGDYRGAVEDYTQAIRLSPGFRYFEGRGDMRYDLKDYPGALADYDEAIRTYGCCALQDTYDRRGLARLALKDYQGALTDFSLAITTPRSEKNWQNPETNAEAYFNRAMVRLKLKDKPGVIADLKRAAALTQEYPNNEVYTQAMRE